MKLNNLSPLLGSIKKKKRLGRGQGSCKGGTSTRGHKGAKSRSGNIKKIGFEGGQMPLQKRIPKIGFKSKKNIKKLYTYINLEKFDKLSKLGIINNDLINKEFLIKHGFLKKNKLLKILGKGVFNIKLTIIADNFSKKAITRIQSLGGQAIKI